MGGPTEELESKVSEQFPFVASLPDLFSFFWGGGCSTEKRLIEMKINYVKTAKYL